MKHPKSAIMTLVLAAALIAWAALLVFRERDRTAAPQRTQTETATDQSAAPATEQPAPPHAPSVPSSPTPPPRVAIMPLDEKTFEEFQEANSRAMQRLLEQKNDLPYALIPALGLREALIELGHDPDQTLLNWMSPQFRQDGDYSTVRAAENFLAIALGDSANDDEFALLLKSFSPELQAAAIQHRAARAGLAAP